MVFICTQRKGSLCSPGNDLLGLNDDSVSSHRSKKGISAEHGSENGCLCRFTFIVVIRESFGKVSLGFSEVKQDL